MEGGPHIEGLHIEDLHTGARGVILEVDLGVGEPDAEVDLCPGTDFIEGTVY